MDQKASEFDILSNLGDQDLVLGISNGENKLFAKSAFNGDGSGPTAISGVTGLQAALDGKADDADLAGKANTIHTHAIANVTGLQGALDAKSDTTHTHAIANVTGLQAALDAKADDTDLAGKADVTHTHAIANVTGLQAALDDKVGSAALADKADTVHTHAIANVTGLQAALDDKSNTGHTHIYGDISNLSGFVSYLRQQLIVPTISSNFNDILQTAAELELAVVLTKGYNLTGCYFTASISENSGPFTDNLPNEMYVDGQTTYVFNFTGLSASTAYTITIELIDGNQTDTAPVTSFTIPFTTTA